MMGFLKNMGGPLLLAVGGFLFGIQIAQIADGVPDPVWLIPIVIVVGSGVILTVTWNQELGWENLGLPRPAVPPDGTYDVLGSTIAGSGIFLLLQERRTGGDGGAIPTYYGLDLARVSVEPGVKPLEARRLTVMSKGEIVRLSREEPLRGG